MITRSQYITEQQEEIEATGLLCSEIMIEELSNEYYNNEICDHCKRGGTITIEVYNNLTPGQQFHFNKHYNHRGDKIV